MAESVSGEDRDDDDDDAADSERPAPERKKPRKVVQEPPQVIGGRFLVATGIVLGLTVLPMSSLGSIFYD
jgi:hypothetical protein